MVLSLKTKQARLHCLNRMVGLCSAEHPENTYIKYNFFRIIEISIHIYILVWSFIFLRVCVCVYVCIYMSVGSPVLSVNM